MSQWNQDIVVGLERSRILGPTNESVDSTYVSLSYIYILYIYIVYIYKTIAYNLNHKYIDTHLWYWPFHAF
jgi:hypothetical protein